MHGDPSTMTVGSERQKWVRVIVFRTGGKAGGTIKSSGTNPRLAQLPSWSKG